MKANNHLYKNTRRKEEKNGRNRFEAILVSFSCFACQSALKNIPIGHSNSQHAQLKYLLFTDNLNIEQVKPSIYKFQGTFYLKSHNNKVPFKTKEGKCHDIQLQAKQKSQVAYNSIHPSLQNPFLHFIWRAAEDRSTYQ